MKLYYSLFAALFVAAFLTSCQDEDYGVSTQEVRNSVYKRNFEAMYGPIDANQIWDFSSDNLSQLGLSGGPTMVMSEYDALVRDTETATRALSGYTDASLPEKFKGESKTASASGASDTSVPEGWYSVDKNGTLAWLNTNLNEGTDHRSLGKSFVFQQPENGLMIIPIYQGQAGMEWELHVVDEDTKNDYNIWKRSDGLLYKTSQNNRWQQPSGGYDSNHTVNRAAVVGRPMYFNEGTLQGETSLYLKVTQGATNYANTGAIQSSKENMMLALSCPRPTNLTDFISSQVTAGRVKIKDGKSAADCQAMIIGCEDADLNGTDHDMNDVVFLVVGFPYLPPVKEIVSKRYMIEDLGSTLDFDFNDIVVDVTQKKTYYWTASAELDKNNPQVETTATVKHLCGTIPFRIKIGNTVLGSAYDDGKFAGQNAGCEKGGEGYDPTVHAPYKDYLVDVKVEGWDPSQNNITVTTWPDEAGWTYNGQTNALENLGESYNFPENGKYPYIIACDQTVAWTKENICIDPDWFRTWVPETTDPSTTPVTPSTATSYELYSNANGYSIKWNESLTIRRNSAITFSVNDQIKVTYAQKPKDGVIQVYAGSAYLGKDNINGKSSTLTISQDWAARAFNQNDIIIKGNGIKIAKVELIKK